MRIRSRRAPRRAFILAAVAATALASFTSVALADDIYNTLDLSIDATAEIMQLAAGGATGTTLLRVENQNGDGKEGCNLTGSTSLVVDVVTSDSATATVSPSRVTFDSCGDTHSLTITPRAVGAATVSLTQVTNSTRGSFNLAPATFTVNVGPAAVTNQAPVVTVNGVTDGANYAKGSVPAATCSVSDDHDSPATAPATLSAITGPNASDDLGSQIASCAYTDGGGLTGSATASYSIIDPSAPSIGLTLNPTGPNGSNGWYVSPVSVTWTVSELESPNSLITTAGCSTPTTVSAEGETTVSCGASSAGGSADTVTETIKLDSVAPTASCAAVPTGWHATDVTVSCTASDATSGLAGAASFSRGTRVDAGLEGTFTVPGTTVYDNAGNGTLLEQFTAQIDRKSPDVTCDGAPTFALGQTPATVTGTAVDGGSDVATHGVGSADTSAIGTRNATITATDNVGNTGTASCAYDVDYRWNGFFQPIDNNAVNKAKSGSTIPVKFSLSGNHGLGIMALNSPSSVQKSCSLNQVTDAVEEYTLATSGLKYDATADQYIYNWKTQTGWSGTCRTLTVKLVDGTTHSANFSFTK